MNEEKGMTVIVKTVARILFPIMILFGIYVILHGHVTPGGGFPGGVIIATGVALLLLAYGSEVSEGTIGHMTLEALESFGAIMLVGLGFVGIILVGYFLGEVPGVGALGTLLSGRNLPILNIGVGIKVGAGLITIMYSMLELRGE